MDLRKFKLGVGPMSQTVVGLCLEYSALYDYPIMIIASRNQVDSDGGYAFTTTELTKFIRGNQHYNPNRVLICRDHCGPYFSDLDKNLSLKEALQRCFDTIDSDCDNEFDLIHVDVGRVEQDQQFTVAKQVFERTINRRPDMMFEFGTEDNTGTGLEDSGEKLLHQLQFVEQYRPRVKFMVSQTGSLTKHTQMGSFDVANNTQTSQIIHDHGLLFKEHNADYLNKDEVSLRRTAGVDAINIAPQLGGVQSSVMLEYGRYYPELLNEFYSHVMNSGHWKKWVTDDVTDDDTKFIASAHYCYSDKTGRILLDRLYARPEFMNALHNKMFSVLDQYRVGYEL
jgi:D-tagatose-1,6-bisphosphate aldolase subunit GatZ/KbaZ